jgi:peptide/nickel transport system ATP-binding protein
MSGGGEVLRISGLKVTFHTYAGEVKALDGVEITVRRGELLGLVGESGCGKSVTTLAVAGLLPQNAEVEGGSIVLDGRELLGMDREELRRARLRDIAIVFQDPMTYLNPVLTVGSQLTEIFEAEPSEFLAEMASKRLRALENDEGGKEEKERLARAVREGRLGRREFRRLAKEYAISILGSVRLPEPEKVFRMYPFELSGGMRQRVMIAMALARRPKLILADEVTTALDVTVQAQILQLLRDLKEELDTSVLLITHDLAVVAEVCDRVAVMYAGNVVEVAEVGELFENPLHPYTKGLLASVPRVDEVREQRSIEGSVPDLISPPPGCRFHPRCPYAMERCRQAKPELVDVGKGHLVSCFLYGE